MRKTNDKRKGKSVFPRTVMCLCLAAALACGTLFTDTLSSYQVRAEEATVDSAAGEAVETPVAAPAATPQVETSETTQDTTTGTQESGEIAAPQSEETVTSGISEQAQQTGTQTENNSTSQSDATVVAEPTAEQSKANVLTANNDNQRKEQTENNKEVSVSVSAEITASSDFADGDTAKISVATEDTLTVLKSALNEYLAKENKEASEINLPLEIGYVNAYGEEQERKENVSVKLTFGDENTYTQLKALNDEGKLSLYHQKKDDDGTTANNEWESLAFTLCDKTDTEAAYIEFTTTSFSPFFFVQTAEKEDTTENTASAGTASNSTDSKLRSNSLSSNSLKANSLLGDTTGTASIEDFKVTVAKGVTYTDGKWVWKPSYYTDTNQFVYDLEYTISGKNESEPGSLQFTLPLHILKDRDGSWADTFDCPYLEASEVQDGDEPDFVYTIDEANNQVIIKNYSEVEAGTGGYIEIGYKTNKNTYEYVDMAAQNPVDATIKVLSDGTTVASASAKSESIYIDTAAALSSTSVQTLTSYNATWNTGWGDRPSDADDYYYLVWTVQSSISNSTTQPYTFTLNDTFNELGGSVVGYKFAGQSEFTEQNYVDNCIYKGNSYNTYRYDYVLTRISKSEADAEIAENNGFTVKTSVKATLTPSDLKDKESTASTTGTCTYKSPSYEKPSFSASFVKSGNWYDDYTLGEFVDDEKQIISLPYYASLYCYPYTYTLPDGSTGDESDAAEGKFGQKNVSYEIVDDDLSLADTDLNDADYDIAAATLSVSMRTATYNTETKKFTQSSISEYKDTDKISVYTRDADGDWKAAAVYNMQTLSYTDVDESIVSAASGTKLTFNTGVKGVKYACENAYYYTSLGTSLSVSLNRTDNVLNIIGDSKRVGIKNSATGKVYQDSTDIRVMSDTWTDYTRKIEPYSEMKKEVTQTQNDKTNKQYYITWRLTAGEYYKYNNGTNTTTQESGTFYDLLPAGVVVDQSSITVSAAGKTLSDNNYTVTVKENYNDTGRTLLTIAIKSESSGAYSASYKTLYSYGSIKDYGRSVLNSAAFETGNAKIAGGSSDDGGAITEKTLLSGLDPESTGNTFIYAEKRQSIDVLLAGENGLKKQVRASADTDYVNETSVTNDEEYSYKIRVENNKWTRAKNVVFFDALETLYESADETEETLKSDFKGTLTGVDVTALKANGIEPVVYLSKVDSMNINNHHDLTEKINGENVWLEYSAFVEKYGLDKAKAVAVDASKATDGSEYILAEQKSLVFTIYMVAPSKDDSSVTDSCAYNNIYMQRDIIKIVGEEETITNQFFQQGYTTVHYRISGNANLIKVDETDGESPVYGASYILRGTSDYGTEVSVTRTSGTDGLFSFKGIEKGTYELIETSCTDDWLLDTTTYTVIVDDEGNVSIEGLDKNDEGRYIVEDAPRIHANLSFKKVDSITGNLINGAEFVLNGTSDYGTDVLMQSTSDGTDSAGGAKGIVSFTNIELGKYKLTETKTIDGYILSQEEYSVTVDDRGVAVIRDSEGEEIPQGLDGYYSIENEPLHTINFVKTSTYGDNITLSGAEFSLTGVSDYGKNTNATGTSGTDGTVTISGLEPGTYQLKETKAPEDHDLNKTTYTVKVEKDGTFTIEGLKKIDIYNTQMYDFKDVKTTGVVKLTKVWKDTKTNDERTVPDMTISTKKPSKNPNGYTITFDANGGSFTIGSKTSETNEMVYTSDGTKVSGTYATPTSDEDTFKGWYTSAEGGTEFSVNADGSPTTTLTEDITVYAQYQNSGIKYAVAIYGIGVDTLSEGTAGLTFGPALGADYVSSYKSHTPSGTTSSGNEKRCVHNDSWSTIISWNKTDPYVYEDCIANGCTHSVELSQNNTTTILSSTFDSSGITGDGPSALFYELAHSGSGDNLRWNSTSTNIGGWGESKIRKMLNGDSGSTTYTSTNCLLATFPNELQSAIGTRVVKYDSVYNSKTDENLKTATDKLWLFSPNELGDSVSTTYYNHPLEGSVYTKFKGSGDACLSYTGRVSYRVSSGDSKGRTTSFWLRSSSNTTSDEVLLLGANGGISRYGAMSTLAVSVGFTLAR